MKNVFVDSAKIYVRAGKGGKGCQSFYRDKYTRDGIPDGGRGGKGADVIIKADRNLHTLLDFCYNQHFTGQGGGHGSSKNKKGKDALPLVVRVPCGTLVHDIHTDSLLRTLSHDGEEVIVACGGNGGNGNIHRIQANAGMPGEQKVLLLDLRLIADVGIVGFPNAGKSTLISRISNARPQIAAYPFTSKFPTLGVVNVREESFVVADIPGLISGSSAGRGLGDKFLRHVERTLLLIHLIDMSGSEGRSPIDDYKTINRELKNYGVQLYRKNQTIVANKMDLAGSEDNLKAFRQVVKKKVYCISALKEQGLEELVEAIAKKLQKNSH